jgi:hypothetical protein
MLISDLLHPFIILKVFLNQITDLNLKIAFDGGQLLRLRRF